MESDSVKKIGSIHKIFDKIHEDNAWQASVVLSKEPIESLSFNIDNCILLDSKSPKYTPLAEYSVVCIKGIINIGVYQAMLVSVLGNTELPELRAQHYNNFDSYVQAVLFDFAPRHLKFTGTERYYAHNVVSILASTSVWTSYIISQNQDREVKPTLLKERAIFVFASQDIVQIYESFKPMHVDLSKDVCISQQRWDALMVMASIIPTHFNINDDLKYICTSLNEVAHMRLLSNARIAFSDNQAPTFGFCLSIAYLYISAAYLLPETAEEVIQTKAS